MLRAYNLAIWMNTWTDVLLNLIAALVTYIF